MSAIEVKNLSKSWAEIDACSGVYVCSRVYVCLRVFTSLRVFTCLLVFTSLRVFKGLRVFTSLLVFTSSRVQLGESSRREEKNTCSRVIRRLPGTRVIACTGDPEARCRDRIPICTREHPSPCDRPSGGAAPATVAAWKGRVTSFPRGRTSASTARTTCTRNGRGPRLSVSHPRPRVH